MSSDTDRLLLDAMNVEAFLRKLAMINLEAQHRLALYRLQQKADPARASAADPRDGANTEGAAARVGDRDPKSPASGEPGK